MNKSKVKRPTGKRKQRITLTLADAIEMVRELHHARQNIEAKQLCEKLVVRWPQSAEGWNYLSMLQYHSDEQMAGVASMRQALELAPDYAGAHGNLGNMLLQQRRISEAQHHLRRALMLDPEAYPPRIALSALLRAIQKLDESESVLRPALEQMPESGHVHQTYANLLAVRGEYDQAIKHYRLAAKLAPDIVQTHLRIGLAMAYSGRIDEARLIFRDALERNPNDIEAQHMFAAMGGADAPARASDDYVKQLFDGFSDSFDAKLADLEYKAPELLTELADELLPHPDGNLCVLDAGCGTGLLAPLIRDRCAVLHGVDLSPGMLDKARPRKLYDELFEAELTAFLGARPLAYDLVVSADTLCYFGAIDEACLAAYAALSAGGWLLFSVENNDSQESGYAIQISGRYAHRRDYVEHCLAQAGFESVTFRNATLRMENQKPVAGLLVAARKPVPDTMSRDLPHAGTAKRAGTGFRSCGS